MTPTPSSAPESLSSIGAPARPPGGRAQRLSLLASALAASLLLVACGGSSSDDNSTAQGPAPVPAPAPATSQAVAIQFAVKANGAVVSCGTPISGLGTGGSTAQLHDLRFYVSEAKLMNDQGAEVPITLTADDWQNDQVALIDLEDGSGACADAGTTATNTTLRGTVPSGTYTGVRFTIGVPSALNHSDYAVASKPMDVQALAWSWQAGRKFLQIEVNPEGGVARPAPAAPSDTFYVHLGSTGCTGNPVSGETVNCARPNRMAFHSHAFNAESQQLVIDLSGLLATSNLTTDGGSAPGCMSGQTDPECAPVFGALSLDLVSGLPIDDGHEQKLFLVESK